jgi:hypothetical protein
MNYLASESINVYSLDLALNFVSHNMTHTLVSVLVLCCTGTASEDMVPVMAIANIQNSGTAPLTRFQFSNISCPTDPLPFSKGPTLAAAGKGTTAPWSCFLVVY